MLTTLLMLAPLTVIIEDVDRETGDVYVSVQTSDQYMQNDGIAGSIEDPETGTMTLEYNVEPGTYAVSIWHDDNGNGEFDRKENGWPLDGYGQSGAGGYNFDDVAITVPAGGTTVTISMTYPR